MVGIGGWISNNMWWLMILMFVYITLFIVLLYVITIASINNRVGVLDARVRKGLNSACAEVSQVKMAVGPQGPMGVQGVQGPPGGTFVANGRLLNQSLPDMSVDRTAGSSPLSVAYLDNNTYTTNQYWTLSSDGHMCNKYDGNCLTVKGTEVHMGVKSDSNTKQRWNWDTTGKLHLVGDTSKCLDVVSDNLGITNSTSVVRNGVIQNNVLPGSKKKLVMRQCSQGTNPNQTWIFQ